MSALLAALERLQHERTPVHRPRSEPTAAPANRVAPTHVEPVPPLSSVHPGSPPPSSPLPIAIAVAENAPSPVPGRCLLTCYTSAAAALAERFPEAAVVALVGCELVTSEAEIAAGLAAALRALGIGPVEVFGPGALDVARDQEFDVSVLRARAPTVLVHLSAEQATIRSAALAKLDGTVLLVETHRTTPRAADVTATTLRLQGVDVRGVLVIE